MTRDLEGIAITCRDFWFKIVDFLQQNWALIDDAQNGVVAWFIDDRSGVFDRLDFASREEAERALRRNGFKRLADDAKARQFIAAPREPFRRREHPEGPIYSSGRFWT